MLGIRLEPDLEARLEQLAHRTGQTKSHHAREAIKQYLEMQEAPRRMPEEIEAGVARLLAIAARFSALPRLADTCDEDELFGYAEMEGRVEHRDGG